MVSSVAAFLDCGFTPPATGAWVEFEAADLPAPMFDEPWIERVDDAMLVQTNAVVIAMANRDRRRRDRDLLEGFSGRPDSTPELSEDASRAHGEWADG